MPPWPRPNEIDDTLPPVTIDPNKWNSSECLVSVIMHCRGRPELLREALQSLVKSCSSVPEVEILVKVDSDDPSKLDYLEVLKSFAFQHKLLIYDRIDAWWSVHIFETDVSRLANGKVLWLFNEDNAILKGDWVRAFRESRNIYPDNIYVCHVPGKLPKVGKCVSPAYSREWFDVMKITSPHIFSDRFLCRVAGQVGRLLSTPLLQEIEFTHRAREKVARPRQNCTKVELSQILTNEVDRCVPLFNSAIVNSSTIPIAAPVKIYPPGTKVGPGYTESGIPLKKIKRK